MRAPQEFAFRFRALLSAAEADDAYTAAIEASGLVGELQTSRGLCMTAQAELAKAQRHLSECLALMEDASKHTDSVEEYWQYCRELLQRSVKREIK